MNRPAGLGQAFGGHPLGPVQELVRPGDVAPVGQHRPGGLDLDPERAERVREHVVDLAGDAGPLVEEVGPPLLRLQLFALGQQQRRLLGLDAVRAAVAPDHQPGDHERRDPQQDRDAVAEGQAADLEAEHARRGHGQGGPQAGVAARGQRGHERERDHGAAAAPGGGREAGGGRDHAEDHRQRAGLIRLRGRVQVGRRPGQEAQAQQAVPRDLHRHRVRPVRRAGHERQHTDPGEAEAAGDPVDRAKHHFSITPGWRRPRC
jgi:hypothetical protein